MSTSFTQYGSLYYSSDLDNTDTCVLMKEDRTEGTGYRFTISLLTGRDFLNNGRITLEFDRGSCKAVYLILSVICLYLFQGTVLNNTS